MSAFLITGNPGSGKTTITRELSRRGLIALDADDTCGIAMNQRDMFDLFTTVFLLSIDHETQLRRLDTPDNADRNESQRAQILDGRETFEREMRAAGAVVLDGSRPTSDLVGRIHDEVSRLRRPR